jgi:hypothetical protein
MLNVTAEELYSALQATLKEVGAASIVMAATLDIRTGRAFANVGSRTRELFEKLASNLTAQAPKA